ncbi:MAG TPA: hypothetical protein VGD02_04300 [Gemmatimonadaceae bacterium]
MNRGTRLRLLLLALGIAAIAAVVLWHVDDGELRRPAVRTVHGQKDTVAIVQSPTAPLTDSEYKARQQQYGVLVQLRNHSAEAGAVDTASFYFVELSDSSQTLQKLGFIAAATLVDARSRFSAVGRSVPTTPVSVTSAQLVTSRLHEREDGCTMEIATPLRFDRVTPEWVLGLATNGGEGITPNIPDSGSVKSDPTGMQDALRIAATLPDSTRLFENDTILARGPFHLANYFRFTADGAEIIVADARRTVQHRITADGKPEIVSVLEQRPFIAERPTSNASAAFAVKWQYQGGGPDDESNTIVPSVALRLGADRLLSIYLSGSYEDGNGGVFISRRADGSWREVAQWVGGC